MKKLLLIVFIIISNIIKINAQDNNSIFGQLNFNTGAFIFTDWKVNQILKPNNLPLVSNYNFYTGWNIDIEYKDFYILPELGVGFSSIQQDNKTTNLNSIVGSISIGYNIITQKNYKLKIGGILTSMPSKLSIYDNVASIDLNNININNPTGKVELTTSPITLGVYLGTEFFSNSSFPLGLSISYQSNLNNSKWNNSYGQTINPINEETNLICCKIFIPIKKLHYNK